MINIGFYSFVACYECQTSVSNGQNLFNVNVATDLKIKRQTTISKTGDENAKNI